MSEFALLKPLLQRLKLTGILESLDQRFKQAAKEKWDYAQFLLTLLDDEAQRRDHKKMTKMMSKSSLDPAKTIETFDFSFNSTIHETSIRELISCRFMKSHENIFLVGPSGVGKSHLAQAIGTEVCRKGHDVSFGRTSVLLKWVWSGKGDGTHERRLKQLIKIPLLNLDDFGLVQLTQEQQMDLYEIICERYEKKSTILTSNRDFSEWVAIFENPLIGNAATDRLVHRATKITIEGDSFRSGNN